MALTHSQSAKQAATNAVVDLLDVGAGANGTLEILDGATVLSTHALAEPAFGAAAADGTATADTIGSATAGNTGTADGYKFKDEDGNAIITGTAGMKRSITAVSAGAGGTITLAGDLTAEFPAGTPFTVVGSTGNDGSYTVASVAFGAATVITIEADQTLADATADGYAHVGELGLDNTSIASGQTVNVSSATYRALAL